MRRLLVAPLAFAFGGCDSPGCIALTAAVPLVEKPYPLGYPSTNPVPNRTVRTLGPGRYDYDDVLYKKDFAAYKLTLADGTRGYVIFGKGVGGCVPDSARPSR